MPAMITLFDMDPKVCAAFARAFAGMQNVAVVQLPLAELPRQDAIVTPGNCFGTMTGGIDYAVRRMFGVRVQDALQDYILNIRRTLSVGEVAVIDLEDEKHGAVIYAPTMFAPEQAVPHNIFYATIAALRAIEVKQFEKVAIPGLGTGAGTMDPDIAAGLMRAAFDAHQALVPFYKA